MARSGGSADRKGIATISSVTTKYLGASLEKVEVEMEVVEAEVEV